MSILSNIISSHLPHKRKQTPSGWISFNAPCCHNNGHSKDTRSRGGLIINEEVGVSYHCFNCGFKCSWQSGRNLSFKMKKFLEWLNVSDNDIKEISFALLKDTTQVNSNKFKLVLPNFKEIQLPDNSILLDQNSKNEKINTYLNNRNLSYTDYNFFWSDKLSYRDRIIIPFYYNKKIVGWTARTILPNKTPKYLTQSQPGFIFNLDSQLLTRQFIIVCEGPIDAINIEGVSILGSEISEQQSILLNSLDKQIIVVPDRDNAGKKLIDRSIELGYSVSLPNWSKDINDINDAVNIYGKLLTLYSIVKNAIENPLKIKLGAKQWFK